MREARIAFLAALGTGVAALVSTHPAAAQDESANPYHASTPWTQPAPAETPPAPAETPPAPETPQAPPVVEPPSAAEHTDAPATAPAPAPAPAAARPAGAITVQPQIPLALPAAASAADTTTSAKTEVAAPRAKRAEQNGIVGGGLAIFLVSYLPATMIAESSAARFDQLLYVPVAGPWLDLARRPICGGAACNTEFGNRALLATDGMLQGLGVLMTIVGLFSDDSADNPQTAKVVETPARRVRVSPAEFGAGAYGVAAFGKF